MKDVITQIRSVYFVLDSFLRRDSVCSGCFNVCVQLRPGWAENWCIMKFSLYPFTRAPALSHFHLSLLLSFPLTCSPVLWGRAHCLYFMYTGCGILASRWCWTPLISWINPRKKGVCFWNTAFCQHSHDQQLRTFPILLRPPNKQLKPYSMKVQDNILEISWLLERGEFQHIIKF